MKKILIISDNALLVDFMKDLAKRVDVREIADFDYRYSVINKEPDSLRELGMLPINIKEQEICRSVIEKYDIVLSLHCKQIFPSYLVKNVTCINVHPGLNPYNRGWYPQVFSIINKKPIGATIHLMNEDIDAGGIIAQKEVSIDHSDTSKHVYDRVIEAEKELVSKNIISIINSTYNSKQPVNNGNYNSIDDFKKLCNLNLNKQGTLGEHIDLLRSLTHGDFKNAYFEINEEKYFVRIEIEK